MIHPIVRSFNDFILSDRKLTLSTSKCYLADLRSLIEWLAAKHELTALLGRSDEEELTKEFFNGDMPPQGTLLHCIVSASVKELREYISEQRAAGLEISTVNRKIASTRSFYRWLTKSSSALSESPALFLSAVRMKKKVRQLPSWEELHRVMEQVYSSSSFVKRDVALLCLFASGARISEVVELNIANFAPVTDCLSLGSNGAKRDFPLLDGTRQAFMHYIHWRLQQKCSDPALFLNKHKTRLSGRSIRRNLDRFCQLAGVSCETMTPRSIRALAAQTYMSEHGADMMREVFGLKSASSMADLCSPTCPAEATTNRTLRAAHLFIHGVTTSSRPVAQQPPQVAVARVSQVGTSSISTTAGVGKATKLVPRGI